MVSEDNKAAWCSKVWSKPGNNDTDREIMGLKTLLIVQHQSGPVGAGIAEVYFDLLLFGRHKNRLPLTGGQLPWCLAISREYVRPQEGQISFGLFPLIQALPQLLQHLLHPVNLPVVHLALPPHPGGASLWQTATRCSNNYRPLILWHVSRSDDDRSPVSFFRWHGTTQSSGYRLQNEDYNTLNPRTAH